MTSRKGVSRSDRVLEDEGHPEEGIELSRCASRTEPRDQGHFVKRARGISKTRETSKSGTLEKGIKTSGDNSLLEEGIMALRIGMGLQRLPSETDTLRKGISSLEGKLQYKAIRRSAPQGIYVHVKGSISSREKEEAV